MGAPEPAAAAGPAGRGGGPGEAAAAPEEAEAEGREAEDAQLAAVARSVAAEVVADVVARHGSVPAAARERMAAGAQLAAAEALAAALRAGRAWRFGEVWAEAAVAAAEHLELPEAPGGAAAPASYLELLERQAWADRPPLGEHVRCRRPPWLARAAAGAAAAGPRDGAEPKKPRRDGDGDGGGAATVPLGGPAEGFLRRALAAGVSGRGPGGAGPQQRPLQWRACEVPAWGRQHVRSHRWAPLSCRAVDRGSGRAFRVHFRVHALGLQPETLQHLLGRLRAQVQGEDLARHTVAARGPRAAVDPDPLFEGRDLFMGLRLPHVPSGKPFELDPGLAAPTGCLPVFGCDPGSAAKRGYLNQGPHVRGPGVTGVHAAAAYDPWLAEDADYPPRPPRDAFGEALDAATRTALQLVEDEESAAHGVLPGKWPTFHEPTEAWLNCYLSGDWHHLHHHARATWTGVHCLDHGMPDRPDPAEGALVLRVDDPEDPLPLEFAADQLDRMFVEEEEAPPAAGEEAPGGVQFAAIAARPGTVVLFPGWVPQCSLPFDADGRRGEEMHIAAALNLYLE